VSTTTLTWIDLETNPGDTEFNLNFVYEASCIVVIHCQYNYFAGKCIAKFMLMISIAIKGANLVETKIKGSPMGALLPHYL